MTGSKVGIREFRGDREADLAAIRVAAAKLDRLLDLPEEEIDEAVAEFGRLHRTASP